MREPTRPIEHADLVIRDVEVVTPDVAASHERVSISIVGDRIVAVGPPPPTAAAVLDGDGLLAVPGLVNAHAHAAFSLSRGWEPVASLDDWLPWVFAASERIGPDQARAGARLAFAEMLLSGITTCVDHHYATADRRNTVAVARAAAELGLRVMLAPTAPDPRTDPSSLRVLESELEAIRDVSARDGGRVEPWVGLASPGRRESLEQARDLAGLARSNGIRVTYHYAETSSWQVMASDLGYRRMVDLLVDVGLLGDDVLLAHGVWFGDQELDILASSGTNVVHNPVSNMYLGDGAAPVLEMLGRGIRVVLGTDGANCNNRLDLFASMKGMALLQRLRMLDGAALDAADAFRAATCDGADAVGLDRGGRLEVGCLADVVLLDVSGPAFQPGHDRLSDIVHVAAAGDVHSVVVAGELLLRDGRLVRSDLHDICADATTAGRQVVAATGRPGPADRPRGSLAIKGDSHEEGN